MERDKLLRLAAAESDARRKSGAKKRDSLKGIVGDKTYSVWVDMLRRLVPSGRTHRLAPAIASMLCYASEVAYGKYGGNPEEGSAAHSLVCRQEEGDYKKVMKSLLPIVERLFKDSRVGSKRTSSKGISYSIAESAVQEFINWYRLPWEQ